MLTDAELQEIKADVAQCERTHAGQQFPYCENYGCSSIRPLLDEIERLQRLIVHVTTELHLPPS